MIKIANPSLKLSNATGLVKLRGRALVSSFNPHLKCLQLFKIQTLQNLQNRDHKLFGR
jgi:hypothetical protein